MEEKFTRLPSRVAPWEAHNAVMEIHAAKGGNYHAEQAVERATRTYNEVFFAYVRLAGAADRQSTRCNARASAETSALARPFDKQDANRVQLRWQHLDCPPGRKQYSPSDQRRPRGETHLFAGRIADCLQRRLRWQPRRVRGTSCWR